LLAVHPQIEAFTGQRWELPTYDKVRKIARDSDAGFGMKVDFPAYDFMAYVRHHGFPSPLLDWSKSPYLAAFFAFRHAIASTDRVAVFAYREYSGVSKVGSPTAPQIEVRGPYVRTHRRHFLQQCHYTMCYEFHDGQWRYSWHERVFAAGSATQDTLWKFTIPGSERRRVLALLDQYNLNAYSLFNSEDALMEMLAARERR